MASIVFDNVSKHYGGAIYAVRDLNLEIAEGEFMVMVGPSGCGKTTALRMVAGLSDITGGELRIGGQRVNDVRPKDRDIAMVFQNYALYPHMSVADNIGFPLVARRMPRAQIDARVKSAAAKLGLTEYLDRRPKNLSGGQRQRVAMGRAIVREPQVYLMDEPLSNLDAKLRNQMRAEVIDLQRSQGVTTLYVTHDQVEAMTMGDRIAIMRKGLLQQVGTPLDLYARPRNLFVAAFLGSPAMNLFEATLDIDDGAWLVIDDQRIQLGHDSSLPESARRLVGQSLVVGIRPEHLRVSVTSSSELGRLSGKSLLVEDLPPEKLVHFEVKAAPPASEATLEAAADIDSSTAADLRSAMHSRTVRMIARLDIETPIARGEQLDLAIDLKRLHFFDPKSGDALV